MSRSTTAPSRFRTFLMKKSTRIIAALLVPFAALAAFGLMSAPSQAHFNDSDTGSVQLTTGTVVLELSDDDGVGTFAMEFDNVAPGDVVTDTFTVKNNGTLPVNVTVSGIAGPTIVPANGQDFNLLSARIDGYHGWAPVPSYSVPINLGNLAAGEERTYTLRLKLDSTAGNNWQGTTVTANATITIAQA